MRLSKIKNFATHTVRVFKSESKRLDITKALNHFDERYLLGVDRFFGNLYIPLLSDILNIEDDKFIKELGVSYLFGRVFVILQDQLLDESKNLEEKTRNEYLLSSPLTFQRMLIGFETVAKREWLHKEMERSLVSVSKHNILEIENHHNRIQKYSEQEIKDLWKKTSLFSLPSLILAHDILNDEESERFHQVICKLVVIIQLCDDLADIKSDLVDKNFTYPITEALLNMNTSEVTLPNVYMSLLRGGILINILNKISGLLTEIQQDVRIVTGRESVISQYFNYLHQYMLSVKGKVNTLISKNSSMEEIADFLQELKDANLDFTHIYPSYINEQIH